MSGGSFRQGATEPRLRARRELATWVGILLGALWFGLEALGIRGRTISAGPRMVPLLSVLAILALTVVGLCMTTVTIVRRGAPLEEDREQRPLHEEVGRTEILGSGLVALSVWASLLASVIIADSLGFIVGMALFCLAALGAHYLWKRSHRAQGSKSATLRGYCVTYAGLILFVVAVDLLFTRVLAVSLFT